MFHRRLIGIRSFSALAIFLTSFVVGCCPLSLMPPVVHADITSDSHPYVILEKGIPKKLYVNVIPLDFLITIDSNGLFEVLAEKHYFGDRPDLACLLSATPKERMLSSSDGNDLLTMAGAISPESYGDHQFIKWIISNDPVIIAIGTREITLQTSDFVGGTHRSGDRVLPIGCYRLLEEDSSDQGISDLYILTKWPRHVPKMGSKIHNDKELKAFLAPGVRHIQLAAGTKIEDVLRNHPWEKDNR